MEGCEGRDRNCGVVYLFSVPVTVSARIHFSPFTYTYSYKSEQSPLNSGSGLDNMRATEVLRGGNGIWNALHFKQFKLRIIKIIARGLTSEIIVTALVKSARFLDTLFIV